MSKLPKYATLETGVLVFGSLNLDVGEIVKELSEKHKAKLHTYLRDNEILDEETKSKLYDNCKLSQEKRVNTVIHINQKHLANLSELLEPLILERRKLRIIFVIEIDKISDLRKSQQNLLFGNFGNFLIGTLSISEKNLLNSLTNNSISEEISNINNQRSTTILSYIEDYSFNRKTIQISP